MFNAYWKSFRRSWVQHTATQLATLTVLSATFAVVCFVMTLSFNLKRFLAVWGESVQMTVYLKDQVTDAQIPKIRSAIETMRDVASVTYIDKTEAVTNFKAQMASYAPDLLSDMEFSHPFPASLQVSFKDGLKSLENTSFLEKVAKRMESIEGVDDVAYGQSWVKNYSAFVNILMKAGFALIVILIAGSVFVVCNSVNSSISSRSEEIEILELVGATHRMIRLPFVFEGAVMGLTAAIFAVAINYAIFSWEKGLMAGSLVFARVVGQLSFLNLLYLVLIVLGGLSLGALGAYLTIRQLNDGWAASQRVEN